MWKLRALWINFRKSTKWVSLRKELFSSIPARLWALSSDLRLATTHCNTTIPRTCLWSLEPTSHHCSQVSTSFGGQEAISLQIILGADSTLLKVCLTYAGNCFHKTTKICLLKQLQLCMCASWIKVIDGGLETAGHYENNCRKSCCLFWERSQFCCQWFCFPRLKN